MVKELSTTTSLILYICSFAISCIFMAFHQHFINSRKNSVWSVILLQLSLMPVSLIAGLRFDVGTDYMNYMDAFNHMASDTRWQQSGSSLEIGFYILAKVTARLFGGQAVFGIVMYLTLLLLYLSIRKFKNLSWSLCLLIWYLFFFPISMNILRQSLAMAVILFAYCKMLIERKYLIPLLLVCAACTLHWSSMIGLIPILALALGGGRVNGRSISCLFIIGLVSPWLGKWIIQKFAGTSGAVDYLTDWDGSLSIRGWLLFQVATLLAIVILRIVGYGELSVHNRKEAAPGFNTLFLIKFCGVVMMSTTLGLSWWFRLSYFWTSVDTVLIAMVVASARRRWFRTLSALLLSLMYVSNFMWFSYINGNNEIFPYRYLSLPN
jgi:hypothetical protein